MWYYVKYEPNVGSYFRTKKVSLMRVAVIGSRSLLVSDLERFLPFETTVIISGGACGIDRCAKQYALAHSIPYVEFLPDYAKHGTKAPLLRNLEIVASADLVLAFWDGSSHGTAHVIRQCKQRGIPVQVFLPQK